MPEKVARDAAGAARDAVTSRIHADLHGEADFGRRYPDAHGGRPLLRHSPCQWEPGEKNESYHNNNRQCKSLSKL